MPNAGEYREAAVACAAAAENLERLAAMLARWPVASMLGQGPVFEVVGARLGEVVAALRAACHDLAELSAICRRRAVVCDEYSHELAAYWARPLMARLGTPPPVPPAPWVGL